MKPSEALTAASHDASTLGIDTTAAATSPQARSSSLISSARDLVHDNPWYAALLATGAGILLGLLLRRNN
jgi:ElaB/YqjD/DUF883 family membrane-anchored ribosome-binding protein